MAPDRGEDTDSVEGPNASTADSNGGITSNLDSGRSSFESPDTKSSLDLSRTRSDYGCYAVQSRRDEAATEATHFTFRGTIVGILIGVIICLSNTYFGLQTGWVSGLAMPASLIGFAVFKSMSRYLSLPFTPVENVLVQTVAGAVGTMPLGCGFVGVIPALEFLLKPGADGPEGDGGEGEGGPLNLSFWKLVIWSLGVCLFGVVFAVP